MLPLGEWRPDVSAIDSDFASEAKNVIAKANSYGPMPGLSPYTTSALAADARGLTSARDPSGQWQIHAGTATDLYKWNGSSWSLTTRLAGTYTADEFWNFAQFGNTLIGTNYVDDVQAFDVQFSLRWDALAGSPPKARGVSVIRDFVVLWGLNSDPTAIQWCDVNDTTNWSTGLADSQVFPDHGRVTGVAHSVDGGFVLQEYAIRAMRFLAGNPDNAFEFDTLIEGTGCISPYGWAVAAGVVYFVAEDGFYAFGNDGLRPIGAHRVNKWFVERADLTVAGQIKCIADPYRTRVMWAFQTPNVDQFNRLLIYDWQLDRWTYSTQDAQMWADAATPGTSLDSIPGTLETVPYPFDSRVWEGGRPTVSGIDTSRRLSFLEGSSLEAVIETPEAHLVPGARFFINALYPIVDTPLATYRVGTRERLQDAVVYTTPSTVVSNGLVPVRASGKLARVEVTIPAATVWTHAQGVEPVGLTPHGTR